jgi:hypothetical protein
VSDPKIRVSGWKSVHSDRNGRLFSASAQVSEAVVRRVPYYGAACGTGAGFMYPPCLLHAANAETAMSSRTVDRSARIKSS